MERPDLFGFPKRDEAIKDYNGSTLLWARVFLFLSTVISAMT
jgi:hypothetical protein